MKITPRQLQILLAMLRDTFEIHMPYGYVKREARIALYEEIINQQSDELKEIE